MDWSRCADVESVPGRVSGAWVLKGTRVTADAIVDHARDGYSAEQIAHDVFPSVPLERVRRVIDFARHDETHPAR
jgi:uncharacterized protein (DUF433 family)